MTQSNNDVNWMKLRVISDGTSDGTYVEHATTGERLAGVQLVSWSASCSDEVSEATIHLWGVPCDIQGTIKMPIEDDETDDNPFPVDNAAEVVDITKFLRRL